MRKFIEGTRYINQYVRITFPCSNNETLKKEIKNSISQTKKLKYSTLMHKIYSLKDAKNNGKSIKELYKQKVTPHSNIRKVAIYLSDLQIK